MAGQLIPLPELAPPVPEALAPPQRIQMWVELYDTCEQFLMAGLRKSARTASEVRSDYRDWYVQQMDDHDRAILRMVEEFNRRNTHNAR
jgi:hypothetical protein